MLIPERECHEELPAADRIAVPGVVLVGDLLLHVIDSAVLVDNKLYAEAHVHLLNEVYTITNHFLEKILPHFDINNLSVAQKLKKLEIGPFYLEL